MALRHIVLLCLATAALSLSDPILRAADERTGQAAQYPVFDCRRLGLESLRRLRLYVGQDAHVRSAGTRGSALQALLHEQSEMQPLQGKHFHRPQQLAIGRGVVATTACSRNKYPVYPDLLESAGYDVGLTGKGWGPGEWRAGGFAHNPAGREYNKHKVRRPH